MHARPNPDALLKSISSERKSSGRLKIYLGMAAGVGKTYAMLSDALLDKARGVDVVAGYIEPHGRQETEQIAKKLENIPTRSIEYRGVTLEEFDLEAALRRRPALILVDELAHTNVPGLRHRKRWQDIEELLALGIDVYTTVNVQHIESLRDVVAKVTRVSIQETVPDAFLAKATDIELIDIPPEELIQRLKEGKIYRLDQVPGALSNFFTKGNLLALRELVLRHAAERVDAQMHQYKTEKSIHVLWPTTTRVMVCVGPNVMASRLLRSAKRLADGYRAELLALHIESPHQAHVDETQKELARQALGLAKDLGAEVIVRSAHDMVTETMRVAQERNVSLIVVGKSVRPRWRDYFVKSLVDEIVRYSGDVDVHIVTSESNVSFPIPSLREEQLYWGGIFYALGITAALTGICWLLYPFLDPSNLVMIYLLGVAWAATKFGRWEAITVSVTGVLAFDFFFVPPRFTFAVADVQYAITFCVMLLIGILISTLTLRVKAQAQLVSDRERRTAALYDLSKKLAASREADGVVDVALSTLRSMLESDAAILLQTLDGQLPTDGGSLSQFERGPSEMAVARWVFEHRKEAGIGTDTLPGSKAFYIPLQSQGDCLGVLGVSLDARSFDRNQHALLEAFAAQVASALERIRKEQQARDTQISVAREKLRSSLLSSVSHDLRTPLASIVGAASVLTDNHELSDSTRIELAKTIKGEAERLSNITRNVLDMTRLDSGSIDLNLDWCSLEELIGAALDRTRSLLHPRVITAQLPFSLPLVKVDGVLIEQLFINLLENIARHTPASTQVFITGGSDAGNVFIKIEDDGPGFGEGEKEKIFEKLYRIKGSLGIGFGLGLSICRAIMTAHGGGITATNRPQGGASFSIRFSINESVPEVPRDG